MLKRPYYTGPSPRRVKTRPFPGFVLASLRGSTQRIRGTLVLQLRIQVELRSAVESFNRPFFPLAPACSGSWRRPHWRQPSPSDQPITGNGISSTIVPDATLERIRELAGDRRSNVVGRRLFPSRLSRPHRPRLRLRLRVGGDALQTVRDIISEPILYIL
jgi:hypothetical protein